MHASGAQAACDLLPQQRRDLIADDAIKDAASLLGVDAIFVDGVWVGEGAFDLGLCDGREHDALRVLAGDAQFLREVPRDGFTLAVKVGCKPHSSARAGRVLAGTLEVGHDLLAVFAHHIGGLEVVREIDAGHRALDALGVAAGQVADVADAGHDHVLAAEILVDRLGLARRFDDDQVLALRITCGVGLHLAATAGTATSRTSRRLRGRFGFGGGGFALGGEGCFGG